MRRNSTILTLLNLIGENSIYLLRISRYLSLDDIRMMEKENCCVRTWHAIIGNKISQRLTNWFFVVSFWNLLNWQFGNLAILDDFYSCWNEGALKIDFIFMKHEKLFIKHKKCLNFISQQFVAKRFIERERKIEREGQREKERERVSDWSKKNEVMIPDSMRLHNARNQNSIIDVISIQISVHLNKNWNPIKILWQIITKKYKTPYNSELYSLIGLRLRSMNQNANEIISTSFVVFFPISNQQPLRYHWLILYVWAFVFFLCSSRLCHE